MASKTRKRAALKAAQTRAKVDRAIVRLERGQPVSAALRDAIARRYRSTKSQATKRALAKLIKKERPVRPIATPAVPAKRRQPTASKPKAATKNEPKASSLPVKKKQKAKPKPKAPSKTKTPTQKIKATLQQLRNEAKTSGAIPGPQRLRNSVLLSGRVDRSRSWLEERGGFKYNRSFHSYGRVLTESSLKSIYDHIYRSLRERWAESERRAPFSRAWVRLNAYTVGDENDPGNRKSYATRVEAPGKKGGIGAKGRKLLYLPGSSSISDDPTDVMLGVEYQLRVWLDNLNRPVIFDSYYISIEERAKAPKRRL